MNALKIIVIVMGAMLVAGFAALAVVIADRIAHRGAPSPTAKLGISAPTGERHTVDLPPGATVLAAQSEGDRVMLRLKLANGGEELMLLDWKTGARLAIIDLGATPAEH